MLTLARPLSGIHTVNMHPPSAVATPQASPTRDQPRYAQLLYTSFDDGSGVGGGWQIKDQRGALTSVERDELTARVVTTLEVEPALPAFPTPEQIAQRPARLAYGLLSGRAAAYWHTVDAGKDATGRPGNVMAHIVLDRDVSSGTGFRPIQLWKSPDWRRPYGPDAVRSTMLSDAVEPAPNPEITAAAAIEFLTGTTVDRQGVFRVLLDAVHAAFGGGPKVILIVDDPANGPRWISAVSFFMSPGTARRFSWCTYDTAALAAADAERGSHLVVIPRSAAAQLTAGDWIVLDEADEPTVRELGSAHSTRTTQITVTQWSTLTEGVLADESLAARILTRQDEVAAEVGDHGLAPSWPLAVAMLGEPDLAEFRVDAQRALADEAPAHTANVAWLNDLVADAVIATAPDSPAEALERLKVSARRSRGGRAPEQFLQVALADPRYLENLSLSEVPELRCISRERWQPLVESSLLGEGISNQGVHGVRRLVRIAELVNRLAEPEPAGNGPLDMIASAVQAAGLDCLWGEDASMLTALTDIGTRVREVVLRGPLVGAGRAELASVGADTWRWLFADERTGPGDVAAPIANPGPADRALYPRYVLALISKDPQEEMTPSRRREIAANAVLSAVEATQISDEECRALVMRLASTARLDERESLDVLTRWPHRASPGIAAAAVLYQPATTDLLEAVAGHPLEQSGPPSNTVSVAAARLRLIVRAEATLAPDAVEAVIDSAAPPVLANLPTELVTDIDSELVTALCGAFIVGQSMGAQWADAAAPLAQALRQRTSSDSNGQPVRFVARLAAAGVIDINWVVAQALLGRVEPDIITSSVLSAGRRRNPGWADGVVALLIEEGKYHGPRDTQGLRDSAWSVVRGWTAADAEMFFQRYDKVARDWLRDYRL